MPKTKLWYLTALVAGCAHHVYSPPARLLPLESVATLRPGETGVQGELGGVSWIDGATVALRARRGFTDSVEGSVEVGILHVGHTSAAGTHQDGYMLRLGAKYQATPWLALAGGVGGGGSAAGGFFSPDLAVIAAWENPYAVPFCSARTSLSLPVGAREVDTTAVGDSTTSVGTPQTTWLFGGTAGVRVPVPFGRAPEPGAVHGSLLFGLGFSVLKDADAHQNVVQGGLGGEVVF